MDEEEQEELRCTGSDAEIEEYTDNEESPYVAYRVDTVSGRTAPDKIFDSDRLSWQRFGFATSLVILVLSVTLLVVSFPLYLESITVVSTAYTGLLFSSFSSASILGLIYFVAQRALPPSSPAVSQPEGRGRRRTFGNLRLEFERRGFLKVGTVYAISGVLTALALDRERVLCHLQDPIKGITLVFSLVYYFFFCRKMMSLQRIFSSTTIIVGLFISVDYGLCDEFRCRGRDVPGHGSKTKGPWPARAVWTFVYVAALAAFAMFFTLLERYYTAEQHNACQLMADHENSLLHTVSRLVSSRDIRRRGSVETEEAGRLLHVTDPDSDPDPDSTTKRKQPTKPPVLESLFYLHAIAFFVVLALSWVDALPGIGRGLSPGELYRTIGRGLMCHLTVEEACANVSGHGWTFLFAYVLFAISALNFLSLSESAVFTVAAATVSLPLSGIWWSIYRLDVGPYGGTISWSPGVTGELICALLGLPVVLLGLALLIRSHLRDDLTSYERQQTLQTTLASTLTPTSTPTVRDFYQQSCQR